MAQRNDCHYRESRILEVIGVNMRLWSVHPKYLDQKGLVAVWREGLLAQSCLERGKISLCSDCNERGYMKDGTRCQICKGRGNIKTAYYNHPQLERFKTHIATRGTIICYLHHIWEESRKRDYNFNYAKIGIYSDRPYYQEQMFVTWGQLRYEFYHLQDKLKIRDHRLFSMNKIKSQITVVPNPNPMRFKPVDCLKIDPHPLFKVISGPIESWEKVKEIKNEKEN